PTKSKAAVKQVARTLENRRMDPISRQQMSGHSQAYMVTRNSFRKCPTSGLHECGPNGSLDCGMNLRALTAVRDNLQDPTASRRIPENVDELLLGSQSFVFYPMGCTQRTDIHGMRTANEASHDR